MIWNLSELILIAGTLVLYLAGVLSGYQSQTLLFLFGVLFLGQITFGAIKRAKSAVIIGIIGLIMLGMWQMAGAIHNGVVYLIKHNTFYKQMGIGVGAADVVSILPLAFIGFIVTAVVNKAEVTLPSFQEMFNFSSSKQTKKKTKFEYPSVRICKSLNTGRDVFIEGEDRFLHTLIVGPTGGGKTALMLSPMVYSDIEFIAKGGHTRVIVVEPDGEFTSQLAEYCEELNVPYFRIDATNPGDIRWNPLQGDAVTVAETLTTVLQNGASSNEFFSDVNNNAARNTTLLLKLLYGDDLTIRELSDTLLDVEVLQKKVRELKKKMKHLSEDEQFTAETVIKAFESELSDEFKKQKYQSVSMGLRQKVNNLIGNPNIRRIMLGESTFRFEDFLETPGVLLLNTGNNTAGDTFGMFFLLSLNDATLRRPGRADERSPIFTYVDEYKRYGTSKYVSSLTQGRKYRNAQTFAFQNFSQLDLPNDPSFKKEVKGNCRNKIILSGLEYDDAQEAALMTGVEEVKEEAVSYEKKTFSRDGERMSERMKEKARFSANDLMLMPWNHVVYKVVHNKQVLVPGKGLVTYAKRKTLAQLRVKKAPDVEAIETEQEVIGEKKPFQLPSIPKIKLPSLPSIDVKGLLNRSGKHDVEEADGQQYEADESESSYFDLEADIDQYTSPSNLPSKASSGYEGENIPDKSQKGDRSKNRGVTVEQLSFEETFE